MGMGIFEKAFLFIMGALIAYMGVWVIFYLSNQEECLRQGYPKSYVTWNFDKYCGTLDGAVTVRVVKQ